MRVSGIVVSAVEMEPCRRCGADSVLTVGPEGAALCLACIDALDAGSSAFVEHGRILGCGWCLGVKGGQ